MKIRTSMLLPKKPVRKVSVAREIIEWAVTLAAAVALALAVHVWVGELITIEGPSMQPGIVAGEKVLVGKVEYYFAKPKRGDIVIVKFIDRPEDIIKRVIATEGEKIKVEGGYAYIDGRKLDEPYIMAPMNEDMPETTVPAGTIFVMGDNRNDSHDSRDVGPIALSEVLGRAYAIVWPTDKWAKLTIYAGTLEGQ